MLNSKKWLSASLSRAAGALESETSQEYYYGCDLRTDGKTDGRSEGRGRSEMLRI